MALREKPSKGDVRRRQVLDAAADCFRRYGFHGASISRISQASGMSPGHIYHYFDTKEQIVEALIHLEESDQAELLQLVEQDQGAGNFRDAVIRQVDVMLERLLEAPRMALMLEIAAEAARNPKIAQILQRSDERVARQFAVLAHTKGDTAFSNLNDPESRTRLEMLPLILSGVVYRALHNPNLDRDRLSVMVKTLLKTLWRQDTDV